MIEMALCLSPGTFIHILSAAIMHRSFPIFMLFIVLAAGVYAQDAAPVDPGLDSLLSVSVSTASKYKQTTLEAPASITVITASDIARWQYTTLAEILNRICGVYTSNDRNYSYVGIRGFSRPTDYNNRILLLVDGHTYNENVYGSAQLGSEFALPLEAIERIEFVRGPGSALYGTGAMFGVVNVITKDFTSSTGIGAAGSLGSFGYRKASLTYGREFDYATGLFISAHLGHSNGTDLYFPEYAGDAASHGIASDLDWDSYSGATAKLSFHRLTVRSAFSERKKGIPTGAYGVVFNDSRSQTLDARGFIEALYTHPVGSASEISVRLYGDRYHYAGAYAYEDMMNNDQSTGVWWGSELRFQWDAAASNRLVMGAEFQDNLRSDYQSMYGSTKIFDLNTPFRVYSIFAQDEFQWFENLAVTGGMRYDYHSPTGGTFSPRLSVNWNLLEGGVVKFMAGTAFRSPNFYELHYADPSTGFKDNPRLSHELITTWEIAVEQRLAEHLQASLSAYLYRMNHLIDQAIDPSDSLFSFLNLSRTHARGIECEIDYQPSSALHCYGSFAVQTTKDGVSHQRLTNSPAWLVKTGAAFRVNEWIEAAAEGSYDSERITVYGTTAPGFALMHAKVTFAPIGRPVALSLGVRNLFDARTAVPGGYEHLQPTIPQSGRELVMTAVFNY